MSQFILIECEVCAPSHGAIMLTRIATNDDLLRKVAADYFAEWRECRLVTDLQGRGEPLLDDLCTAQQGGFPIEETTFVRFLWGLFDSGVGFVIWQGADSADLPTVHSWSDALGLLRAQTRLQPADVYLRFVPPKDQTEHIRSA